ncbi:NAD(P)/FAD-dependent oxidoreductase [Georgenia sp. 10Sc9-8]|uniref:NAD(P)/FAD-dependent oxidoreductase n=1 Tax=Georgenia halotolerans TaxID=3028317 RepID=A0ABT5U0L8_9MICO|nr:NAD(P)/FAD-dependent oxidoreductase [Georgenia halotolerans]
MNPEKPQYDVVVIGGGPAGLAAALVLGRARRSVLLTDAGRPRNRHSAAVHGYLTRDGTPPEELLAAGRAEVDSYGVERAEDAVTAVAHDVDGFRVTLAGGRTATARRVVAATGLTDHLPDVAGLAERWGRDVLHCPYCHGHEVRDQQLTIIAGDSAGAIHQALLLRQWSEDLTLLLHDVDAAELDPHERRLLDARGVAMLPGRVTAVLTEGDRLTGLRLADGTTVRCAAVFAPLQFSVNDGPLAGLGPEHHVDDMGTSLATDAEGRTSVPGLWAVGNVADLSAQVLDAAASGARAAIGINGELSLEDAENALAVGAAPSDGGRSPDR